MADLCVVLARGMELTGKPIGHTTLTKENAGLIRLHITCEEVRSHKDAADLTGAYLTTWANKNSVTRQTAG